MGALLDIGQVMVDDVDGHPPIENRPVGRRLCHPLVVVQDDNTLHLVKPFDRSAGSVKRLGLGQPGDVLRVVVEVIGQYLVDVLAELAPADDAADVVEQVAEDA